MLAELCKSGERLLSVPPPVCYSGGLLGTDDILKPAHDGPSDLDKVIGDGPRAGLHDASSRTARIDDKRFSIIARRDAPASTMNALFSLALRQVQSLQADLTTLEQAAASRTATAGLHGQITASLAALQRTIDDYEGMSKSETVEAKRDKAKRCVCDSCRCRRHARKLTHLVRIVG